MNVHGKLDKVVGVQDFRGMSQDLHSVEVNPF